MFYATILHILSLKNKKTEVGTLKGYQYAWVFPWQCISPFGGTLLQQNISIPKVANCASLQADMFLNSYESDCLQNLVKDKEVKEIGFFNFKYH